jgi:hypothetical protein
MAGSLPKYSHAIELNVTRKLMAQRNVLQTSFSKTGKHQVCYSRKIGYFLQVLDFEPDVFDGKGNKRPPSEFKSLRFDSKEAALCTLACLNSNLFYWFVTIYSDCRHVNKREVELFPIDLSSLINNKISKEILHSAAILMRDLKKNSIRRIMTFQHDTLTVQCILPKTSKPIIDQIDTLLAHHYGFTPEELDYIINYDIKYRMGGELDCGEED